MALHETLNLRKDEILPVAILVFQSVFLGFFLGAFDVSANTLFLNSFDQSMIPKAIVVSGITGILLTSLYSFFQSKLEFSKLAVLNLFTVFALTFLLRAGYYFSDTKWLAFGLFVLMGPLNIVALVGFWGTVGRIFDLRQGKRIFGFIDTGQVVGVIISSFSIPFLISLGFKTNNLLYISAVSAFLAFVLQIFIGRKYSFKLKVRSDQTAGNKNSFASTLKIPYVRTMAMFVILSMLVAFFVHYLFLAVASQRFQDPDEMAKFFGGLMGSLTFVSVLLKSFVYGPLMKTYGLRISLLVSPFIMFLVSAGAAIVGSLFGFTLESATFTFFFLLISLGKFFQKALKDSIESPVLKLIYQSLPPSIRHEVQARVDGTINESAALASGVILSLLGLFAAITLLHYVFILIGFIVIWFYVSLKLFSGYRKTLKQTLENASLQQIEESPEERWFKSISHLSIAKQIDLVNVSKPWLIPLFVKKYLPGASGFNLKSLCDLIEQKALVETISELDKLESKSTDEDKNLIAKLLTQLQYLEKNKNDENIVVRLMSSKEVADRVRAAQLIGISTKSELKQQLTFLLRDLVPQVKRQAIWAARGKHSKEIISFLIDFLDKDEYAPLAHSALINSGEVGLEMLLTAFNRSGASDSFQKRIIRVIPDTGSAIAQEVLFGKLAIRSSLKTEVLNGLLRLNFLADERESVLLHQMIIEQAGVCAWNLNVMYHCPSSDKAPNLRDELESEFYASRHNLFQILKLLYDKSSIDSVIENLEAGTGESISFAIELLDTFVVEDLKPYIFPILEDNTLSNKIWALQNYFPLPEYTNESLFKAILNRNENLIGKRAKIYALNAYSKLENVSVSADLVAQLFNSDRILRQLSGELIKQIDSEEFARCRARLGDKLRVDLDRNLQLAEQIGESAIERLEFFSNLHYSNSPAASLFWLYNSSTLVVSEIDILSLSVFKLGKKLVLVEKGNLLLEQDNYPPKKFLPGDIMICDANQAKIATLKAAKGSVIHYVDYSNFMSSIYNYDYLIDFIR